MKVLADLQALPALLAVTVTPGAGPGESALGTGNSQYPLVSSTVSLLLGHMRLESAAELLPRLSWAFTFSPSQELEPQPGVWGFSGKIS